MKQSTPTSIYLADFILAVHELNASDAATQLAIARMLSLYEEKPSSEKATPDPEISEGKTSENRPSAAPPVTPPERRTRAVESQIEHFEEQPLETPFKDDAQELFLPEEFPVLPPLEPLFSPKWVGGILIASLSTESMDGEVDVDALVDHMGRGKHISRLNRLALPTLNRGLQLLVDKSQGMTPYFKDQKQLLEQMRRVVGRDRMTVLNFAGSPLRGAGQGPITEWVKYKPPLPGTPVVLLTDLGIGRPRFSTDRASAGEWLRFIRLIRKTHCPLVAFIPYAPSRWPLSLSGLLTAIQWDRNTTATVARNVVGRALKIKE
jgi:hypothetical protein